ncbi:MAG: DUF4157 domain-containing protein, partial [Candidatus Nitrotoga sp.]
QAKLTIGASNDPLEQEADRVADQVLAAPAHSAVSGAVPSIQRFTRQSTDDAGTAPASVDRVLSGSGRPLDPALQQDMGKRFGHDFSQVRVHTDGFAEQSAQEVHAHAYTVGHNMVFGAGRYEPGSQVGRRLIAHELTHVVQQLGADEMNVGQSNYKRGSSPVAPMMHPPVSVALRGVAASVLDLQRAAGNRTVRAPLNGSSGGGLLQREPDDPLKQGLDEARRILREADEVAKDLLEEVNGGRMLGKVRIDSATRRLKQKLRNLAHRSPHSVMDTEADKATRLLDQIEELERKVIKRRIERERVIGAAKTKERAEKNWRAAKEKADKKAEHAAGMSGEAATKAEKFAAKSTNRSTAGADLPHTTRIRATATSPGEGSRSPVTSRDIAVEVVHSEASNRRMAAVAKAAKWALIYEISFGLLEQIATARNMAASTLANVTPYQKEIRQANAVAASAKDIADYYNSLDLRKNIPATGWGAFDAGWYNLQQIQFNYYQTESHLHDALKSVLAAKKNIAEQISGLMDKLREKERALLLTPVSTPYADLAFYSDAARLIIKDLSDAADSYEDARKSIYLQKGMAQASIKFIEMRLRELGVSGLIFIDIADANLKVASLDNFTMRR